MLNPWSCWGPGSTWILRWKSIWPVIIGSAKLIDFWTAHMIWLQINFNYENGWNNLMSVLTFKVYLQSKLKGGSRRQSYSINSTSSAVFCPNTLYFCCLIPLTCRVFSPSLILFMQSSWPQIFCNYPLIFHLLSKLRSSYTKLITKLVTCILFYFYLY